MNDSICSHTVHCLYTFFTGAIENVNLELHSNYLHTCGGNDIYIEILQGIEKCTTKSIGEYGGYTASWSQDLLGTCTNQTFDKDNHDISFKLKTGSDAYCPKKLNMVFVGGTTFESKLMNDWVTNEAG